MTRCVLPTIVLMLAVAATGAGAIEPLGFDDPAKQERYERLLEELRCLVCQNESLASSDADLAGDLRQEVHEMVATGRTEAEIKAYLVERYGDFVLYRPRMTGKTYLLWFGPALLVLAGLAALGITIHRRARAIPDEGRLSETERERLNRLLEDYPEDR